MGQAVTITPDAGPVTITPDQQQPSVGDVLTQPTDKTDQEYLGYAGAAGVAGATVKGLNDVARGTKGALAGMVNAVRHPIDTAKGIAQLPSQAAQVPAAIHDINQSPDPLGHYAEAAQDTASQGAGQALTALAGNALSGAAPYVGPVGKALVKGYAKKVIPGEVGEAFRAVRDAKAAQNPPVYPGASEPNAPPEVLQAAPLSRGGGKPVSSPSDALGKLSVPPVYPGAHLPEAPPPITNFWHGPDEYPVTNQLHGPEAPEPITNFFHGQPEAPSPALFNSRALAQPGAAPPPPPPEPSAGLGQLPVPRGSISQAMQQPIQRGSLKQMMGSLDKPLAESVGASPPPAPNKPIYQRGGIASQIKSPIAETPAAEQSGSTSIPEGHTAIESSALRSYKYDPDASEFHANYKSGNTVHVFGDVSPEEAQAFENAPSKGQAMQAVKNSHPLVGKIVDGKRIAVKASQ